MECQEIFIAEILNVFVCHILIVLPSNKWHIKQIWHVSNNLAFDNSISYSVLCLNKWCGMYGKVFEGSHHL